VVARTSDANKIGVLTDTWNRTAHVFTPSIISPSDSPPFPADLRMQGGADPSQIPATGGWSNPGARPFLPGRECRTVAPPPRCPNCGGAPRAYRALGARPSCLGRPLWTNARDECTGASRPLPTPSLACTFSQHVAPCLLPPPPPPRTCCPRPPLRVPPSPPLALPPKVPPPLGGSRDAALCVLPPNPSHPIGGVLVRPSVGSLPLLPTGEAPPDRWSSPPPDRWSSPPPDRWSSQPPDRWSSPPPDRWSFPPPDGWSSWTGCLVDCPSPSSAPRAPVGRRCADRTGSSRFAS